MARRRHVRYTPEFKAEAPRRLQESDRPIRHIARDRGLSAMTLHRWINAARPAPAERLTSDERTELVALRRDVHQWRQDRDILNKATAVFATQRE